MGCLIQGNRFNHAGSLEFRVMRDGDPTDPAVRPCLPVGGGADGGDFSFSLVFWQFSGLSPEKPLAPTYNFFKIFLRSADRSSKGNLFNQVRVGVTLHRSAPSRGPRNAAAPRRPPAAAKGLRNLKDDRGENVIG